MIQTQNDPDPEDLSLTTIFYIDFSIVRFKKNLVYSISLIPNLLHFTISMINDRLILGDKTLAIKMPIYFRLHTLLDHCLKNYTTLWNIWTYQLLCKKNYTTCVKFELDIWSPYLILWLIHNFIYCPLSKYRSWVPLIIKFFVCYKVILMKVPCSTSGVTTLTVVCCMPEMHTTT